MVALRHLFEDPSLELGDPFGDRGEVVGEDRAAEGARDTLADCLRLRLYARITV